MSGANSEKVVSLHGLTIVEPDQPVARVLEMLQVLRERAERGELVALSYVAITGSHGRITDFFAPAMYGNDLVAGILIQSHRIVEGSDDDN